MTATEPPVARSNPCDPRAQMWRETNTHAEPSTQRTSSTKQTRPEWVDRTVS